MPAGAAHVSEAERAKPAIRLPDGSAATIRPVRSTDEAGLISFHRSLSNKTVCLRYFSPVSVEWRTCPQRLAEELCRDAERQCTLVIERRAAGSGLRDLIGVGRLVIDAEGRTADFALAIRDDYQGMGLGTALMEALIGTARERGMSALTAEILPENRRMLNLCRDFGFELAYAIGSDPVKARLALR